jgi:hypothetical protein
VLAGLADKARDGKLAANWVINELFGRLNKEGRDITSSPVSAAQLAAIVDLIGEGTISGKIAKDLFEIVWIEGGDPRELVESRGMKQVTDLGAIEKVVDDIIAANPDKVAQAKAKPQLAGWFVGQVMKQSGGKANPQAVNDLLKAKLGLDGGGSEKPAKKDRDVLFEDRKRTRLQALQRGERLFDYYDECARSGYEEFRSIVNRWLSDVAVDDRRKLISRMRSAGNNAFGAALCELTVHAWLVAQGFKVVSHPSVPGVSAHPDFEATDTSGNRFYVEVTTVNRADETVKQLDQEALVYNAVNQAKLPAGCLLGYELVQAGAEKPDVSNLQVSVERWVTETAGQKSNTPVLKRFAADDWVVELELFSGGSAASGTPAIGVAWQGGGVITPHRDIRGDLWDKSVKYGDLDAPYLIVVADAKGQVFGKDQAKNAVTEAVFGDEVTTTVDGRHAQGYDRNGLWLGPEGPRNQRVTGILLIPQTDIWKLREQRREPILALNPWADASLPDSIKDMRRVEAVDGKWIEREGKAFADVLGLPTPWPPSED